MLYQTRPSLAAGLTRRYTIQGLARGVRCARIYDLGRSGPNLQPGTLRVYVINGSRNGLNIGRKAGPCLGTRRRLGC